MQEGLLSLNASVHYQLWTVILNLYNVNKCSIFPQPLTPFTVPSLKSSWTATHPRSSTAPPIHALWVTQSSLAVLPHVAFRTLADLLVITPATIGTFLVTFWIRAFNRRGHAMQERGLFRTSALITIILSVLALNENLKYRKYLK